MSRTKHIPAPSADAPAGNAADQAVPGQDSLAEAARLVAERNEEQGRLEREHRQRTWTLYTALLLRSKNPQPRDAQTLLEMVCDLGITAEQLTADRETIEKAVKLHGDLNGRGGAVADAVAGRQAFAELGKQYERRALELRHAIDAAEQRISRATDAPAGLEHLRRRRPELFEPGSEPAQLLSPHAGD